MPIKINEDHKRVVEITLWMLDKMLCKFDRWISNKEEHSVLYDEINPLTTEQCNAIENEIKESKILLTQLRDELELKKHSEPLDRVIHAMGVIFAADDLVTIKGKQIEAYGKAESDLIDYLDVKVTKLIERLHNVSKIALHGK